MPGHKEQPIYWFSAKAYDDALDDNPTFGDNIIRVLDDVDEEDLFTNPLDQEDFEEDSVVVFDDCTKLKGIKERYAVQEILDLLLECARSYNITIICTSHILSNYKSTRTINNECTSFTVFPKKSGGLTAIRTYLDKKIGMSNEQRKKFLSMSKNSIFVTLNRCVDPMVVLSEKEAYTFDPFDV